MWFVLALVAMLCWSGSDLFSKIGSKPDDKHSHWKMVIAVGMVMGIHAMVSIFGLGVRVTLNDMIRYLPASAFYISSMILGYIGLRYIELSVSSPICNCSGAASSLFLLIFFFKMTGIEDNMTLVGTILGIAFCAVGVLSLGIVEAKEDEELKALRREKSNVKYTKSILAILLPVLYLVLDAGGTVADAFILETMDEEVANTAYELTFCLSAFVAAVYLAVRMFVKKEKIFYVSREWPKLAGGVFETAGQFAYVYAIAGNAVAAAPIISCYCAVSVLWGRIFLKEKLSWRHYVAILIAVIGIAIMGIFGGD